MDTESYFQPAVADRTAAAIFAAVISGPDGILVASFWPANATLRFVPPTSMTRVLRFFVDCFLLIPVYSNLPPPPRAHLPRADPNYRADNRRSDPPPESRGRRSPTPPPRHPAARTASHRRGAHPRAAARRRPSGRISPVHRHPIPPARSAGRPSRRPA